MNKTQKQIIIGSLLGDGSLSRSKWNPTWNWKFVKNQSKLDILSVDKISYINYHILNFNNFKPTIYCFTRPPVIIANNKNITSETHGYKFSTKSNKCFTELGKKWYRLTPENKLIKIIPQDIKVTPLSLCIWYMDDGSKEKGINRVRIATNCFQDEEVALLISIINKNFKIEARLIHNSLNQPMIEIGGYQNYKNFYNTILPHIQWDCFQHKIEKPKEKIILSGEEHPQVKLTDENIKEIIKLYKSGLNQTDIAIKFDVKANTISTILNGKSRNNKTITQGVNGARNPRAKLTYSQVNEIRKLHPKMSYNQLAKKYQVSKGLIASIIKKRCWD